MALRPIDVSITVQRTPEVNRNQTGEAIRPETAQQQFAEKLNRDVQQQERQVNQTHKAEENRVGQDGKGNSGGYESGKRNRKNKDEKPKASSKTSGNSLFDVSI